MACIELAHGSRIARRKLRELWVRAHFGQDLPRPRALGASRGREHDSDARHLGETEGVFRTSAGEKRHAARDRDLGEIDAP
jgi:hypothetical protein